MLKSKSEKQKFQKRLLAWFDEHQRDLPWRRRRTPYRIWVSEIMLQQTQVATVIDYFNRFIKRFPSVRKLAQADEAEVLKLWEGLGYYRRARQMHAAANLVVEQHGGKFPTDYEQVRALPGIGRYTAGAILSISQDQRLPILEGNTIRVFARLMVMRDDPRSSENQKQLWAFSESLLPEQRCGDFNQALMELGSEVCRPKRPSCLLCPVRAHCPTGLKGLHEQIPASSSKVKYEDLHEAVVLVERRGKFLVRLCGPGERWQGLWDFPRFRIEDHASQVPETLAELLFDQTGLRAAELQDSEVRLKHAVTRFRIKLDCYWAIQCEGRLRRSSKTESLKWMTASEIEKAPMSITGRKVAKRFVHG